MCKSISMYLSGAIATLELNEAFNIWGEETFLQDYTICCSEAL